MRLRHRRREEFARALEDSPDATIPCHWTDLGPEPSAAACLVARAATIRAAARAPVGDRATFVRDRCRDRRVLDIGCVAHDSTRATSISWLHAQIADVASELVGVDVLEAGIRALQAAGMNVICHDFSDGLGPFAEHEPYEVIVAGEVIEHLGSPEMLFRTASSLLAADGVLVLTTPNPYAPDRVRAGQRGVVHENVDHVLLAFPSGIAELAERAGLRLIEYRSTTPRRPFPASTFGHLKRWIRGSNWVNAGVTTRGPVEVVRVRSLSPTRFLGAPRLVGETMVYVVGRPQ